MPSPGFRELAARLVRYVNDLVRRGEVSERGLARRTGYSQPHMHNVLHGRRALAPEMADRVLDALGLPLAALLADNQPAPPGPVEASLPAVLLAGRLGGGDPYPREMDRPDQVAFPSWRLQGLIQPAVSRVSPREQAMLPAIHPDDWILLDRSPHERRRPSFEHVYGICWQDRGFIRRCQLIGDRLLMLAESDDAGAAPTSITLRPGEILDVIRARVVWLARDL